MGLRYDEIVLTDSAYRHGYHDEDVAQLLRGRHLLIRSRRGVAMGWEVLGRNVVGEYLLIVGRVVESEDQRIFRVFHIDRMTEAERRRYRRFIGI